MVVSLDDMPRCPFRFTLFWRTKLNMCLELDLLTILLMFSFGDLLNFSIHLH